MLKARGTKRLKRKYDKLLSILPQFCFQFQLEPLHPGLQRRHLRDDTHGEAVQVDPIKPKFKPPGTERLKLGYDKPLPNVAFSFNLRLYTTVISEGTPVFMNGGVSLTIPAGAFTEATDIFIGELADESEITAATPGMFGGGRKAGAYNCPLVSST
jgi:hypothetical protein